MFNFKKGGLFSRLNGDYEDDTQEKRSVLAVWGSPNSGKTTVSVKLAKYLADENYKTALLLCDMTAPMLPCICPSSELDNERSLGSILAASRVTESLVRHNCVMHKEHSYLTILGLLRGEHEFTYPQYSEKQAKELINALQSIADYIIIDCGSYIVGDILSAVSLMEAHSVLQLANCDLKSVGYLSSQLPLLIENQWNLEKHYKTASNVKRNEADEHVEQLLGNVAFKLPHSNELENQYLDGGLFKELSLNDSRGFRKEIEKICQEVFGL